MYNLLLRYVYEVEVDARVPAITEPVALTREGVFDVRARTARLFVVRFVAALLRDTTPRVDVAVVRVGVVRDETVLFAPVPRDTVVRVALFEFVERDAVVRDVVARDTVERLDVVAFARGLVRPNLCGKLFEFTIGSANTDRIETNVEHTKNAAANRNIVPIAFFTEFVFMRNVIKISCLLLYAKRPEMWAFA